ncbi:MAG: ankyrin repeat domain-containing protein [Proteobacteria bacterium]|nr:ankyrin repeat domain-containing protein [Pseudomonadota bacterium]
MARQRNVYCRTDVHPPPAFTQAVLAVDPERVEALLTEGEREWVWTDHLFLRACRPVGFEGHGGSIPDEAKKQAGRCAIVRSFVAHGADPSMCNRRKVTPLHMACRFDLPEVVETLIDLGARIDAYDASRETPIYRAINLGYIDCLRVLLSAGTDLAFQNRKGLTPLHRAVMRGKKHMVPLLLEAGADPQVADCEGKQPVDYCRNKGIRAALDEAMA